MWSCLTNKMDERHDSAWKETPYGLFNSYSSITRYDNTHMSLLVLLCTSFISSPNFEELFNIPFIRPLQIIAKAKIFWLNHSNLPKSWFPKTAQWVPILLSTGIICSPFVKVLTGKKIQRITRTANGIKRSYVTHQALHKKKAHPEPKVLLLAAPMD